MSHPSKKPDFSQIVCSAGAVRTVFDDCLPTRLWWAAVLWLHGKPIDPALSAEERIRCVANGFRFYAGLYRLLAGVFLLVALLLLAIPLMDRDSAPPYWVAASLFAALYLWIVSGLGYTGAASYRKGEWQGVPLLVTFIVTIIAFLSMFLAGVSIAASCSTWLSASANLSAAGALLVFGVGSYIIEVVYLVTERPLS